MRVILLGYRVLYTLYRVHYTGSKSETILTILHTAYTVYTPYLEYQLFDIGFSKTKNKTLVHLIQDLQNDFALFFFYPTVRYLYTVKVKVLKVFGG